MYIYWMYIYASMALSLESSSLSFYHHGRVPYPAADYSCYTGGEQQEIQRNGAV
jgi:hypothetical protein